jgi:uncharacterized protein
VSQPGSLTSPVAGRPGLTRYAPQVRVVRLGNNLLAEGERGDVLTKDVLGDLVRAEVTRVNTGISQYTLTFNNWFLATAVDRSARSENLGEGSPSEAVETNGNVSFWPRFKYNDLGVLCFGNRLRIDMRYVPEPTAGARTDEEEQTWTPMVSGPITDMQFSFAGGAGAQLTVSGEDDLSPLKDKQEKRVRMERQCELNNVKQALKKSKFPLAPAEPLVKYPDFVTDDGQGPQEVLETGQSVYDFIQKMAGRLDFEVFLEFAALNDPAAPLEFHFEPYRGRAKPVEALRTVFRLEREKNLLDFNPTIKVGDQYSKVVVKGRHRDALLAKEVRGEATHTILADELHRDESLDGTLRSGPEVRSAFFGDRANEVTLPNQPNLDDVRADWSAKTTIRKKARELFSIEATTIGVPRLRPGNHVEIRGMRPPFDGFFYITKTVHTFGADGYRTKISACRPGLELPPYKEKRAEAAS